MWRKRVGEMWRKSVKLPTKFRTDFTPILICVFFCLESSFALNDKHLFHNEINSDYIMKENCGFKASWNENREYKASRESIKHNFT